MNKYIITEEQIEAINDFLKNRNTLQIRKVLNELEQNKVIESIENIIRNLGRSNMIHKDELQAIIIKYRKEEKDEEEY